MTITTNKLTAKDVYLEHEENGNWQIVFISDEEQPCSVELKDAEVLCRTIHQLTHMLPMKRLKEEDKQELIFAMEQILPHIYRNYILDEYVLD